MADMEMEEADQSPDQPILGFGVLQFIKTAQSQHGLRHNDFKRYRQYCTKKLHRSRRNLKMQQGKGKFTKKKLELSHVESNAHLQLPLVDSERSWAFAMECKGELDGPKAGLMRQAMLRRLRKASAHAAAFSEFAATRADPRTQLEAEAYAAHIAGLHLLEYSHRQPAALAKLQRAQKLCEELAGVGSFEERAVAQQRLDEIEPAARFADYQLRKHSKSAAEPGIPASPTTPNVKAQLSAFTAGNKEAVEQAPKASGEGPAYIQWRGSTYTTYGDRLKGFITQAKDALPHLTKAEQAGNPEEQLAVLEKLVTAFNEAKSIVRHSIATSGGSASSSADVLEDLKKIDVAISGQQLEYTIQKNRLTAHSLQLSLDSKAQPEVIQSTKKSKGKGMRGRGPSAIVRSYDTLLQNVKDLTEVAGQLGGAAGEYLLDECSAKAAEFQAQRCLYLARVYLADAKPREAHALFNRAAERAKSAGAKHEECARPDAAAVEALESLQQQCGAWQVVAHAKALESEEKLADGVRDMQLAGDGMSQIPVKYLMDDLDSWKSYAGDESEPARLAPIPPRLQLIPVRPFLLDNALSYIQPPDLSHCIPKQEKKSAIGRIFGWGS